MFIIAAFVLGFFTMLLWNWLVPSLFHGPELNYLQSVGLLVLTRLLVGIRGPKHHWWHWKQKWGRKWNKKGWYNNDDDCGPWGGYANKWSQMTPEEKRNAKEAWCSAKEHWKSEFKKGFDNPTEPEQSR
jgi:hypothetical protein